ncbi:unnamed protein product [Sphenostylis stenocarpa]|uniref:Uncharacterized protein n=1 Tax=Sphenostylis stenocarpa TaxID=92480 RepID=A0AA86VQR9_9FABA|nr:unnamed protein product [Sphenostylis stenocarpa]
MMFFKLIQLNQPEKILGNGGSLPWGIFTRVLVDVDLKQELPSQILVEKKDMCFLWGLDLCKGTSVEPNHSDLNPIEQVFRHCSLSLLEKTPRGVF